jgi:soluble lytic murein transglycosylase-like protein
VTKIPTALAFATLLSPLPAHAGTFWSRERPDGVIEFTNIPREGNQKGKQWKVWLKAGPSGKAAALRGATDPVPPRDRSDGRFSRFDQDIRDGQATFGIPEAFLRAVIKTESDFDPRVVSSAGAQGLMQLLPETGRQMGVTDPFDPRQNIMGGARYLQVLARRFCRTPSAAPGTALAPAMVCSSEEKVKIVAGYHAGPGAVEKYGGIPPYETTRAYVAMVMRRYEQYRQGPSESAGPAAGAASRGSGER